MKKRILGLLLAVCLVVSLLPLASFAATPAAGIFWLGRGNQSQVGSSYQLKNKTSGVYWFSNGATDTANPNNLYTTRVTDGSLTDASNSYIKFDLSGTTPVLTLKNVNIKNAFGLTLGTSTSCSDTTTHTTPYNVVLIGENTIRSTHANYGPLDIITTGDVTISGEGSLKLIGNKSKPGGLLTAYGNLILDNVDVSLELKEDYGNSHGIAALGGNITINGGSLNIVGWDDPSTTDNEHRGDAIKSALYASKNAAGENGNITIDKSDVKIVASAYRTDAINAAGAFTLKDSDFELSLAGEYATYNKGKLFGSEGLGKLPTFTYTTGYTAVASTNAGTYATATGLTVPVAGDIVTYDAADVATYKYFKVTHNHSDDGDCTTADTCTVCGTYTNPAATNHTPAADDGDCTTAIKCTLCGTETTAAKAAHTPAADDGDCTTAITCTVCGTETTAAKTHTGGTASCTKKAECANCGKEYGELKPHKPEDRPTCDVAANCEDCGQVALAAGQHSGGTATCKDKAKCEECGVEYGELLTTHVPAADDGDCTTAIKCTICDTETTAAKAAHVYTDDQDTTCDNAGCTKTRVVEPKPTEPKPTEPKPTEPKPTETKPAETKPAETKPAETKPAETKPAETKPAETKPNGGTNGSPNTGDTMNLGLWFTLLAVSAIGFAAVVVFSKKRIAK